MFQIAALALALPLHFEPTGAAYWMSTRDYAVRLSISAIAFNLSGGERLMMNFPRSKMRPEESLPGRSNYYGFASGDRAAVPHYGRIRYESVFRGVDLCAYGKDGELEY